MTSVARELRGGVIPAVPVPFRPDGTIDTPAQDAYVAWMASQAVAGVAVWAHTGRGPHLTDAQRAAVLQAWRSGMPHTRIVCGVGLAAGTPLPEDASALHRAVLEQARSGAIQARDGGADLLMAHPPRVLAGLPSAGQRIVEYHAALCDVGVPVIAFLLYEAAGGVSYDSAVVRQILAIDGVIGIKIATLDSIMTFQDTVGVIDDRSKTSILSGEDRFLGYSLMCGAHGALVGLAAACTDVVANLLRAWREGRHADFVELSARVDRFAAATFRDPMEGYVQRMLWALEDDGVLDHAPLDRFGPRLDHADRRRVRDAVRALRA